MDDLVDARRQTRARWDELLAALADREQELAARFLDEVENGARYYDNVPDEADLRDSACSGFRYILTTLREQPLPAQLAAFPREVGARRAQQGVALENLVAAAGHDFPVAWSTLLTLAAPQDSTVLAVNADLLWRAVNAFVGEVQQGYLEQRLALARADVLDRQQCLSDLFAAGGPTVEQLGRAAGVLGLPPEATYRVVATPDTATRREVLRALESVRATVVDHVRDDAGLVLVAVAGRADLVADPPAALGQVPCGVGPCVAGLALVHRSAAVATLLAATAAATATTAGPATLRTAWARLSVDEIASVIDELRGDVLAALQQAPDHAVVIETVRAYAEHGSAMRTASALFCHRNTVLNRMKRFEDLTGLDLHHPRHQAVAQLCLLPARNRGAGR